MPIRIGGGGLQSERHYQGRQEHSDAVDADTLACPRHAAEYNLSKIPAAKHLAPRRMPGGSSLGCRNRHTVAQQTACGLLGLRLESVSGEPYRTLRKAQPAQQHQCRQRRDDNHQSVPYMRIAAVAQDEVTYRRNGDVAYRRQRLGGTDRRQPPAPRQDLGYVVRIEAVLAADAESHDQHSRRQIGDAVDENDRKRSCEDHSRAEPEIEQIAAAVAQPPEQQRSYHDACKRRGGYRTLRQRR